MDMNIHSFAIVAANVPIENLIALSIDQESSASANSRASSPFQCRVSFLPEMQHYFIVFPLYRLYNPTRMSARSLPNTTERTFCFVLVV